MPDSCVNPTHVDVPWEALPFADCWVNVSMRWSLDYPSFRSPPEPLSQPACSKLTQNRCHWYSIKAKQTCSIGQLDLQEILSTNHSDSICGFELTIAWKASIQYSYVSSFCLLAFRQLETHDIEKHPLRCDIFCILFVCSSEPIKLVVSLYDSVYTLLGNTIKQGLAHIPVKSGIVFCMSTVVSSSHNFGSWSSRLCWHCLTRSPCTALIPHMTRNKASMHNHKHEQSICIRVVFGLTTEVLPGEWLYAFTPSRTLLTSDGTSMWSKGLAAASIISLAWTISTLS